MSDSRDTTDRGPAQDSRQGVDGVQRQFPGRDESVAPGERWSRRRFGKTALGVTPVIATLYGRPLWAAANCTPSGWISGNTSMHHELEDCGGYTPGYWQGPQSKREYSGWEQSQDELLNSSHCFAGLDFYVQGEPCTMQQAVEGPGKTPLDGADMLTRQLIRFGTAALLNARYVVGYSLTEPQVIEMVAMAVRHGGYTTPGGDYLSDEQVKAFLENTMNTPNWGGSGGSDV
ncbi:MAG: hypothetical protein ACOCP9_07420 [Halofilum sp. (in: g-proteobacteria)]